MDKIIPENICSLCKETMESPLITFPCNHCFCIKCFSYLQINLLQTLAPKHSFFELFQSAYHCLFCGAINENYPFEEIFTFTQNAAAIIDDFKNQTQSVLCERCEEKVSTNYCSECDMKFCDGCKMIQHKAKKFQVHRIQDLEGNTLKNQQFKCDCGGSQGFTAFCLDCEEAVCSKCVIHNGHKLTSSEEILIKASNIDEIQEKIKTFQTNFSYEGLKNAVYQEHAIYTEKFKTIIEELINQLQQMKIQNEKKSQLEIEILKIQIQSVYSSFSLIDEEIRRMPLFHPNKQYQIQKLFQNVDNFRFSFTSSMIPLYENQITQFKEISDNFSRFQSEISQSKFEVVCRILEERKEDYPVDIPIEENSHSIYLEDLEDSSVFSGNPLERREKILERQTFYPHCWKSSCACTFQINNQSFVAWAGYSKENTPNSYFPVIVFNLSQNKRANVLQAENKAVITSVQAFPKDDIDAINKKWLYCTDSVGNVKFYDISSNKPFFLTSQIKSAFKKPIIAAIVFHDSFHELEETLKRDETHQYIIMHAMDDNKSFAIFRQYGDSQQKYPRNEKWDLYKKIESPNKKLCATMNFYYDENIRKLCIFFGFTKDWIWSYDLKTKMWRKTIFETKEYVTSMNFLLKRSGMANSSSTIKQESKNWERFLIYAQWNSSLVIGSIDRNEIVRKLDLPRVYAISDCFLWNYEGEDFSRNRRIVIIVATFNRHSLQILDFQTLESLNNIEMENIPSNILKVSRKNIRGNQEIENECLLFMKGQGLQSEVVLY